MLTAQEIMQLIESLIWLLAGVGVFIVGMNFMGDALERSAGQGAKESETEKLHFTFLLRTKKQVWRSPYLVSVQKNKTPRTAAIRLRESRILKQARPIGPVLLTCCALLRLLLPHKRIFYHNNFFLSSLICRNFAIIQKFCRYPIAGALQAGSISFTLLAK